MIREKERTAAGELGAGAKRMIRCPQKVGINMNMREKHRGAAATAVIGVAVIVLLAGCVAKFGVIDRYRALSDAQSAYDNVHRQYESAVTELLNYDRVLAEYRTYSRDWMTGAKEGEGSCVAVSRQEVLDLVEARMKTRGTVNRISVRGNTAVIDMGGMSLDEISDMFEVIEQEPIVAAVRLDIAETEKDHPASILSFSVTITLQQEVAEE